MLVATEPVRQVPESSRRRRCQNAAVQIQKLTTTDAFIVFDLDGAPGAGITRSAPKILVDGATALARTLTYRFASFERQVSGASAGINAKPEDRAAAVAAYVAEVSPLVAEGRWLTEPGRGLGTDDLVALRAQDPRPAAYFDQAPALTAAGVAAAAQVAAGGLEGRTVAIEGFDAGGPELAVALDQRGAQIVAVSTAAGTAVGPGLTVGGLAEAWSAAGPQMVDRLAGSVPPAATDAVFGVEADVLVVGSKSGVIDDQVAGALGARIVVPSGPTPVTAKALAALRRAGTLVLPDFVTTAGPLFAGWPGAEAEDPTRAAIEAVEAVLAEVVDHPDGPLLGACYRAEAFLATWRTELPFGRPIA
jgi:glutamate dehydrogenase (NAD(P)+)